MADDLFESISQRSSAEEAPENIRIHEIADELRRCCQLYEAKLRDGEKDVNHFEVEQRAAELYAKRNNLWIPLSNIFDLGVPGPSGNENDLYVSNNLIYKVNNLLNSGSILTHFDKMICHNTLFYETAYSFHAFTGIEGRTIMPIFVQRLVKNAIPATSIEIDTYLAALGFNKMGTEGRFKNQYFEVWDMLPRNVLKDSDGDIYIVDAEIKRHV
ncbi:MAG: hypothetical protein IKU03_02445 [Bacteroidales bacterium]|nr:hypothetical protein [Bacteroidales bacterium]